jgi:hypothetical protein
VEVAALKVSIMDKDGWKREFTLERAIAFIGTDPRCDIVLDAARGGGILARHAQVIGGEGARRLVNLSEQTIGLEGDPLPLPPRGVTEILPGSVFQIGDWRFEVLGDGGPLSRRNQVPGSAHIGARVVLPVATLSAGAPIDGKLLIKNAGDETAVQFRVELNGLPAHCIEVANPPMLFPGAMKELALRLINPGDKSLSAGEHELTARVTAPYAYPGEAAISSARIRVAPNFAHAIRVIKPEERL